MLVMVIVMKVMLMKSVTAEPLHFLEMVGGWVYHLADDIHFSICTRKQVLKYKIQLD